MEHRKWEGGRAKEGGCEMFSNRLFGLGQRPNPVAATQSGDYTFNDR